MAVLDLVKTENEKDVSVQSKAMLKLTGFDSRSVQDLFVMGNFGKKKNNLC